MRVEGWYYLHDNGSMIYKPDNEGILMDFRDSNLVVMFWPLDPTDRAGAWRMLVEGLAVGAKKDRIVEIAEKWGCNDEDAEEYAKHLGLILKMDGDQWCAHRSDFQDLQASPAGFGTTCLEAMAELCKALDYKTSKLGWASTFADLVKVKPAAAEAGSSR